MSTTLDALMAQIDQYADDFPFLDAGMAKMRRAAMQSALSEALAAPPVAPAAPAPQGWRIRRLHPEVIEVIAPDGSGCAVGPNDDAPRVVPTQVLYMLCDAMLAAAPPAPDAAPAEGTELPPHVCDPIPPSQAAERYRFEDAFKASALRRHLRLDHFLEADNAVQYASRDVRALWAGWLLRCQSAAPAEGARISQIDADYWLRHRSAILQAIADKGYTLTSNRSGFWLGSLGKIEAQAAAPTEAPNDQA